MGNGEKWPEAFGHLVVSANHVAERAWTGLYNFLTAQSVLALAWATMLAGSSVSGKGAVMLAVSAVGAVTGFMWAMLSTRMWHYHLEYADQLEELWSRFTVEDQGLGAGAWSAVDAAISERWRQGEFLGIKKISGNQWVLFLVPILLAVVHLVMWTVAVVYVIERPADHLNDPRWVLLAAGWVGFGYGFRVVWRVCKPVLDRKGRADGQSA